MEKVLLGKVYDAKTKREMIRFLRKVIFGVQRNIISTPQAWGIVASHLQALSAEPETEEFDDCYNAFFDGMFHPSDCQILCDWLQEGNPTLADAMGMDLADSHVVDVESARMLADASR